MTPHVPFVQVNILQPLVSVPQSAGFKHCTHAPLALHITPPFCMHAVRTATGGFDGAPFMQRSIVHVRPSTGRSLPSGTVSMLPAPSHCLLLQSLGIRSATGVPFAAFVVPQVPFVQVLVRHSESV